MEKIYSLLIHTNAILLKTQTYHWNVVGSNFHDLHVLFQNQYEELFLAIDSIAEHLRMKDVIVDTSENYYKNIKFDVTNNVRNSIDMLNDLSSAHVYIVDLCKEIISDTKDNINEADTNDLAIDRLRIHQKYIWLLKSTMSI